MFTRTPIVLSLVTATAALLQTLGLAGPCLSRAVASDKTLLVVAIVGGQARDASFANEDEPGEIQLTKDSLETVKKKLAKGEAVLIDVRDEREWEAGHLRDAHHLPLKKILEGISQDELAQFAPGDKIVYLHCASGNRSLQAARQLRDHGRDIRPLKPGYEELAEAGFATAD